MHHSGGGRYQTPHLLISDIEDLQLTLQTNWLLILEVLLSFFPLYLFFGHRFTNLNIIPPWGPSEDDQEGCVDALSKTHALNIACVKQTFILVFLRSTHRACRRRTISVVFQRAHFSSAGTRVRREFPLLSGKRSRHWQQSGERRRRRGWRERKKSDWLISKASFLLFIWTLPSHFAWLSARKAVLLFLHSSPHFSPYSVYSLWFVSYTTVVSEALFHSLLTHSWYRWSPTLCREVTPALLPVLGKNCLHACNNRNMGVGNYIYQVLFSAWDFSFARVRNVKKLGSLGD